MNKALIAVSAILVSVSLSQSAVAETLDIAALKAASADYQLGHSERVQPRRSALFAIILDQLSQGATLASLDTSTPDRDGLNASES